jgi:phenylalanyl-tRNA synthetase beta subunit
LDEAEISARLKNLGYAMEIAPAGKDKVYTLTVPSWRLWDVAHPDDIIEDVARSVSLNRVKAELPALDYEAPPQNAVERIMSALRPALRGGGFVEVITKGFYSQAEVSVLERLAAGSASRHVTIKNALEQSNSHMKSTNIVHLARVLAANLKRDVLSAKVFEVCRVFELPEGEASDEPRQRDELDYNYERDVICLAATGRWYDQDWRKPEPIDQFARLFKGEVANVIRSLGGEFSVGKSDSPYLHPGIQGSVKIGRSVCGVFGAIHPSIRELVDLRDDAFYCELDMRVLLKAMADRVPPQVSDFPPICRDLTLKVAPREQAGRVLRLINEATDESLRGTVIVDDFHKEGEDYRRVTYRLTFQRADRTLRHDEVDAAMGSLLSTLKEKFGFEMAV